MINLPNLKRLCAETNERLKVIGLRNQGHHPTDGNKTHLLCSTCDIEELSQYVNKSCSTLSQLIECVEIMREALEHCEMYSECYDELMLTINEALSEVAKRVEDT